jgi:hypothetical protein
MSRFHDAVTERRKGDEPRSSARERLQNVLPYDRTQHLPYRRGREAGTLEMEVGIGMPVAECGSAVENPALLTD